MRLCCWLKGRDLNWYFLGQGGDSGLIVHVHAAIQHQPGDGAIHHTGVKEQVTESLGKL
jgi:hypothetical protein